MIRALPPEAHRKPVSKMLHQPYPLSVDTYCRQIYNFSYPLAAVRTRNFDISNIDIGTHINIKILPYTAHKLTDAVAPRAAGKFQSTRPDNNAGFRRQVRLAKRLVKV